MEDQSSNKRTTRFTRNKTEDISNMLYAKIPPQARELEEAVLGAILIEKDAFEEIIDILKPEKFYVDAHATIFKSMSRLYEKSEPIDLLTVTEDLRKEAKLEEVGGGFYLSELTNKISSSANIEFHSRIIVQKFIQRELIRISNDIIRDAYEDTTDVFDLLDAANDKMLSLNNIKVSNVRTVAQIEASIKRSLLEEKASAKIYKLGIGELDLMSKTFNIIGGYPGTGKTAFMSSVSDNLEKQGFRVGIFSIEMSDIMLVARQMQRENSISAKRIITGQLSNEEKEKIFNQRTLSDNIYVDDSTNVTDGNILLKAKSFLLKYNLDVLWIDFFQMIQIVESKNLEVKIMENISRGLQNIAKDLDKCVIGLSQLTKTQNNEKPTMHSIRGGGLEQAASDIILLYDEYSSQNNGVKWKDIPIERRGKIKAIYAKGRYTEVGNTELYFDKPRQYMTGWNERPYEEIFKAHVQEENDGKSENFDIF